MVAAGPGAPPRESLTQRLRRLPGVEPGASEAGAAVTIVLREGESDLETLLVQRANRARDPASGQVSLPGGHVDPTDRTLVAAALRELEEEVGLSLTDLTERPRLFSIRRAQRFGLDVGVFVAELAPGLSRPTAHSPSEVAEVFWLPRGELRQHRRVLREGPEGVIEVEATLHTGHVLWGFTLRVLREFFAWWDGGTLPPPRW